jgi:hypothetical protein
MSWPSKIRKFELGVGNDDAALAGVIAGDPVQLEAERAGLLRDGRADDFGGARERDVLVMSRHGLGRRREDRGRAVRWIPANRPGAGLPQTVRLFWYSFHPEPAR